MRCPDCATPVPQRVTGWQAIQHAPGCPVAADVERAVEGDRRWFADRPGTDLRRRRATWGERAEHALLDPGFNPRFVEVRQMVAGARLRLFLAGEVTDAGA